MTTIENLQNQLENIKNNFKSQANQYVNKYLGEQYSVNYIGTESLDIVYQEGTYSNGNPRYQEITIYFRKYNYETNEFDHIWQMNVGAFGTFDINGDSKATRYYTLVGKIMNDKGLEGLTKKYVEEINPIYESLRKARNNERKIEKEKQHTELLKKINNLKNDFESHKDKYVAITKEFFPNSDAEKIIFTYRNKDVMIYGLKWFDTEIEAQTYLIENAHTLKGYKIVPFSKLRLK